MGTQANEEKVEPEQIAAPSKKTNIHKGIIITWKIVEKLLMIVIVFICAIILTQRLSNNDKAFLGFRIFRVETGSMIPVYNIGDVIIIKEKDIDKIKKGDDVTYWGTSGTMKGKIVTHRVVDIEEIDGKKVFHTKGVANKSEDPIIYGEQINGVVIGKLHILTTITLGLADPQIFYFCGIIPLTVFVFFAFVRSNNRKFDKYK